MTKLEAIRELIWDTNNKRPSKASLKRIRKAGQTLGLSDAEQVEIEIFLDYRRFDTAELFPKFQEATNA